MDSLHRSTRVAGATSPNPPASVAPLTPPAARAPPVTSASRRGRRATGSLLDRRAEVRDFRAEFRRLPRDDQELPAVPDGRLGVAFRVGHLAADHAAVVAER